MIKIPTREQLLDSLRMDADAYFDYGRQNNLIDVGLSIAAIVTSLIAAAVSATDLSRWIRVGAAAVPIAFTSIQKVVEVRSRSNWYFSYAARLRSVANALEYAREPDIEEYGKRRAAIDLEMESGWGQIGRAGTKSRARPK